MDENKVIEKMRMLKLHETVKIIENKIGKQEDKREWEKALLENKVTNVKYMGKAEINGEWQDIYMLLEQYQKEVDGKQQTIEVEKYVTENLEYIAGDNKQDGYPQIFLSEKYANQKDLLEQIQNMDEKGILDLNDWENARVATIAQIAMLKGEEEKAVNYINLAIQMDYEIYEKIIKDPIFFAIKARIQPNLEKTKLEAKMNEKEKKAREHLKNTYILVGRLNNNDIKMMENMRKVSKEKDQRELN